MNNDLRQAFRRVSFKYRSLCCLVLCVAFLNGCEGPAVDERAGEVIDRGWFSTYPRYRIVFDAVPIQEYFRSRLEVPELPSEEYSFYFLVLDSEGRAVGTEEWNRIWHQLQTAQVVASLRVSSASVKKSLDEYSGLLTKEWQPFAISGERMLKPEPDHEFALSGRPVIEVSIATENPEELEEEFFLQPVLVGGGFRI